MMGFFEEINIFMEKGGTTLWFILLTLLAFWILVLERYYFFKYIYPTKEKEKQNSWSQVTNKDSWFSQQLRQKFISEISRELNQFLTAIKTLIVLFPLLGLLGTITGMIAIFDIMSFTGTGNARLMASGISMAVIPTMAGMVAAISGLYFSNDLEKRSKKKIEYFTKTLKF